MPDVGIHHHERQILGQAGVLEAVIHDNDVRRACLNGLGARRAVGRDHGRRHLREQQRLVANDFRALIL